MKINTKIKYEDEIYNQKTGNNSTDDFIVMVEKNINGKTDTIRAECQREIKSKLWESIAL